MKRIKEDISKGEFRAIYVLYGQEAYLQKQYRDNLLAAVLGDGDAMNFLHVQGKDYSIPALIDFAETMPFFAERRVIILENTGILKSGGEMLAEYLENPCDTTVWILVENEIDKRSKLFKAANEKGLCVEFEAQDEATLKRWVFSFIKKEGKQITERTLELFLEKTGTDMNKIRLELEKLLCYTLYKDVIEAKDVEEVCTTLVTSHVFDMVDAIGMRNQQKALQLYNELQALREPPTRILYLVGRQMNILLQIKDLKKRGADNNTIAKKVGVPSFAVPKYFKQAALYKTSQLKNALECAVKADEDIKRGVIQDKMSVELLIFELTGMKKADEEY